MKEILVTIQNGEAKVAPKGWSGLACQKATADLEAAMGMTVASVPTAEMRATTVTLKAGA